VRGFVAAFDSAAWLHGLDGFDRPPPPEVIGAPGRRIRGIDDLIQHAAIVTRADVVDVEAIPCTNLARTICDVTAKRGRLVGLRALDDFERRGNSLRWLMATADRLHRPGQSGTRLVRQLLAERSGRAPDSWFERLVGYCLLLPGMPPWTRQHEVRDSDGHLVGRIDLACVPLRLGVEAHSKRFHFGAGPGLDDQERDDELAAVGWDVRYVGWHAATRSPEQVARRIDKVARRRAQDLGVALPWAA
jgi:hypothetical protein